MTAPFAGDPLAGYTPDWRKRLQDFGDVTTGSSTTAGADPLAGYSPDWRSKLPPTFGDVASGSSTAPVVSPVAPAVFGAPEPPPPADPAILANMERTAAEGVNEGEFSRAFNMVNRKSERLVRQAAANIPESVIYGAEPVARTAAVLWGYGPEAWGEEGKIREIRNKALEQTEKIAGGPPKGVEENILRTVGVGPFLGAYQGLARRGAKKAAEAAGEALGQEAASEAGIPSSAILAGERGRPISTSRTGVSDLTQAEPFQSSVKEMPSGPSISRDARETSVLTGPTETLGSGESRVGSMLPSGWKVLQPVDDGKVIQRLASEDLPNYKQDLEALAHQVPGAKFGGARVKELGPRLDFKAQRAGGYDAVNDYLGARIQVESPEAASAIAQELERRGVVLEMEDFLHDGATKGGYRAMHATIRRPNGVAAELQIIPREIAEVQEEAHHFYEVFRDPTTPTAEKDAALAANQKVFDDAWVRFATRNGAGQPQEWFTVWNAQGNKVLSTMDRAEAEAMADKVYGTVHAKTHLRNPPGRRNIMTRGEGPYAPQAPEPEAPRITEPTPAETPPAPGPISRALAELQQPAITPAPGARFAVEPVEGGRFTVRDLERDAPIQEGIKGGALRTRTFPSQQAAEKWATQAEKDVAHAAGMIARREARAAKAAAPEVPRGEPTPVPQTPPAPGPISRALAELHPKEAPKNRVQELEQLYGSDDALGVTYNEEHEMSVLPNGEPAATCTNCAREIVRRHGGGRIVGYGDQTNPTAGATGDFPGSGHDFAILEDRYIVDPWVKETSGASKRAVFDLTDKADQSEIRRLYGEPSKWVQLDGPNEPIPKPMGFTEADRMQPPPTPDIPRGEPTPVPQTPPAPGPISRALAELHPPEPEAPERIVGATFRNTQKDGAYISAPTHGQAKDLAREAGLYPMKPGATTALGEEGFVTDRGRFVNRAEALQLARGARQAQGKALDPQRMLLAAEDADLAPRGEPTRITSNTGNVEADYAALPADRVHASNQPTDLGPFQPNPRHPGNERLYAPGSDQHLGVLKQAGTWDPLRVLNTDPTPVGGPPIVVPWTRELAEATGKRWEDVQGTYWTAGGNSRVMAQDLLRQRGRGAVVDAANHAASPVFGLPDVEPGHLIVRIAREPVTTPEQARRLVSLLNEQPTKALGVEEGAVSAGQKMSPDTRDWFGSVYDGDQTLRGNLQSPSIAKGLRERLAQDGVIDASSRDKYFRPDGTLTEEGKTFVERMMLGRAVPDPALLQTATPAMVNKIEAIATLVDRSSVGGPGYDLREPLAEILRRQGGQSMTLEKHLAQMDMLQGPPDESVTHLWQLLDSHSAKELREKLARYVDIVEKRVVRSGDTGLGLEDPTAIPTPGQAFQDAYKAKKPSYRNRAGVLVQTPAAIAGAAAGGAVGGQEDTENPSRGMILGALVGAVGGVALGAGGRALARRGGPKLRPGTVEAELENIRAQRAPERFMDTGPVNPDDYVNVKKFALDESGSERLRTEVSRIVKDEGIHPKQVVSWDQTRAMARELGVGDLTKADVNTRLGGPEMLGIRNIVRTNLEALDGLYGQLKAPLDDVARKRVDQAIGTLEHQNDALLGRFIRARTQTGRDLNNLKILANRVMDPVAWVAKATNMMESAGAELTVAQRDRIRALVQAGDKEALVNYMMELRPVSRSAQAMSLWKTGLLTNPKTHIANILGNVAMAGLETAKDLPSSIVDRVLSLGTGQHAKSLSLAGTAKATWRGAKAGAREAADIMRNGVPADMSRWDIPERVNFKNPILRAYTQTISRGLAAPDAFFRKVALHRALAEAERLGPLTEERTLQAVADAEYAVFQGGGRQAGVQSRLARAGEGFRKPLGPVGHMIAPFTRTPGNLISATIDYSPFGAVRGARDVFRLVKAVKAKASPEEIQALQKAASEQLGRTATGTGGAFLGGYILARNGLMTGARPSDNRTQDQWDLAGKQENAVRIGDRWWGLSRVSPIGNLMALGANYYELTQNPEAGAGGAIAGALGSIGTTATEQSFLRGVQEVQKAVEDPAGQAGKYAKQQVASLVPAIVGAVAREMDPVVRDTKGGFLDALQSRIPGMSQKLPAQVNQLGQEKRRDGLPLGQMFDPTTSRAYKLDDPVIRELERTGAGIGELNQGRARPAEVRKLEASLRNTQSPTTRALLERRLERAKEGEERGAYLVRSQYEGKVLNQVLQRVIQNENYRALPEESQKEVLESAVTKVRQRLSRMLRSQGVG